jgi:fructokinase
MLLSAAGEALIDLVPAQSADASTLLQPCLGGSVFNFVRALAKLGAPCAYLNPLSADAFGQSLRHALIADGVQLAQHTPSSCTTSLAVVQLDGAGKAAYSFYREGVADRAINAAELLTHSASSSWVMTGCLALDPRDQPTYLPWLAQSRRQGQVVAIDVNLRPSVMAELAAYRRSVLAACEHAHVLKASDDDLVTLFDLPDSRPRHVEAAALELLKQSGASLLALTRGERGAQLFSRQANALGGHLAPPAGGWHVADTVGAGDCFFAGLVHALMPLGNSSALAHASPSAMRQALVQGLACASFNVARVGAQSPTWQELQQVLNQQAFVAD